MFAPFGPFGQSSNSPFGSSSASGHTNDQNGNLFASRPIDHIGSSTMGTIYGGTSTSSSGFSSSPSVGSSMPAFGASSTPAFGSSSSPSGSYIFSHAPASGGFGSSHYQPNAFAGASYQTQSTSGSSTYGSFASFGGSSQPAFGSAVTTMFGNASTDSGVFKAPSFGSGGAFGASSSPSSDATSSQRFTFSCTPTFGHSISAAGGGSLYGTGLSPSGIQTSPIGSQTTMPIYGSTGFGQLASNSGRGGSRVESYRKTVEDGGNNTQLAGEIVSISAMPAYRDKSHEVLRWEDHQSGDQAFGQLSSTTSVSSLACYATSGPAFGGTSSPALASSEIPTFGNTSTASGISRQQPSFGSGNAFGASSSPAFGPTFGHTISAAGGASLYGMGLSTSGIQTSPVGSQTFMPTFGSTGFGQLAVNGGSGGSRVAAYRKTAEDGGNNTQPAGRIVSISAMPTYRDKSHEELRWEDNQSGDKGGRNPAGDFAGGIGYRASVEQSNLFKPSTTSHIDPLSYFSTSTMFPKTTAEVSFGASITMSKPFSPSTISNPFAPRTTGGVGLSSSHTQTNPFSPSPSFNQTTLNTLSSSTTPNSYPDKLQGYNPPSFGVPSFATFNPFFNPPVPALNSSSLGTSSLENPFVSATSSTPSTALTLSAPTFAPNNAPCLFPSTSPLFVSSSSILSSTSSPAPAQVDRSGSGFSNTMPIPFPLPSSSLGQSSFSFPPSTAPSMSQTNLSSAPSDGSGLGINLLSSLHFTSNPAGFRQSIPSFSSTQPSQTAQAVAGFTTTNGQPSAGALDQIISSQTSTSQSTVVMQPSTTVSPFGTLPAVPQMSIGRLGSAASVSYGISSIPVLDNPAPGRNSSFRTSRYLSRRRTRVIWKYDLKIDGIKVPFYSGDEETPNTNKAGGVVMPRENPRGWVINPTEPWSSRATTEKTLLQAQPSTFVHDNGENLKLFGPLQTDSARKEDSHAATVNDIKALMPKLQSVDYYTKPSNEELAAKERTEPGFCGCVKDFVIGRHGYGYIKFLGETDVRHLDLDSVVQFNTREVIVYMDERKKPPVGHGLNKPAEITLLNVKCIDKKTGKLYTDGPRVNKYTEMLIKKAGEQGAEFVSYDPVEGEWKFRVQHFSQYEFKDDDNTHTMA